MAALREDDERAARLWGASEQAFTDMGYRLDEAERQLHEELAPSLS